VRKTYSNRRRQTVTIAHGPDSHDFLCEALPAGYSVWVRQVLPAPRQYVNGKPKEPTPEAERLHNARINWLYLAKGLESDGCLDGKPPAADAGRKAWEDYADGIEREFVEANFDDSDLVTLLRAVMQLTDAEEEVIGEDAGGN